MRVFKGKFVAILVLMSLMGSIIMCHVWVEQLEVGVMRRNQPQSSKPELSALSFLLRNH